MNQLLLKARRLNKSWMSMYLPLAAIIIFGAFLRFYNLGAEPLWTDEGATWGFTHLPLSQLWGAAAAGETNPPLYYTLQKFWLIFGQSEAALRSLSAIIGTLTIPLIYGLGQTLGGHWLGVIAAALLATSDINIQYSQEARAYALFTAAATLTIWGLASLLKTPAKAIAPIGSMFSHRLFRITLSNHNHRSNLTSDLAWFAYIFGMSIALYSHNTAVLLYILTNIIAFVWWITTGRFNKQFFWNWLIANLVPLLFYAWWLPIIAKQSTGASTIAWIPFPTIEIIIKSLNSLYGHSGRRYFSVNLFTGLVFILGIWKWRVKPINILLTLTFIIGAPLLGVLVSFYQPIFITKIFVWTTILFFILIAAGTLVFERKPLVLILVSILIVFQLIDTQNYYNYFRKEPWDQVAANIKTQLKPGDVILAFGTRAYGDIDAFLYYFNKSPISEVPYHRLSLNPSELPAQLIQYTQKFDRVFLVTRQLQDKDKKGILLSEMRQNMLELNHQHFTSNLGKLDWFLFKQFNQPPK
ncbi:MAG: glycosyltransferase family 39 protein [Aphanocapsa sp. GSE-SYN-MK-11-07L]|nr:glycosyltransferase family 39 protein [Aphanocapsa sp. GSE-SYN-MK-11-07L]